MNPTSPFRVLDTGIGESKFWVVDDRGDAELGNWLIAKTTWRQHAEFIASCFAEKFVEERSAASKELKMGPLITDLKHPMQPIGWDGKGTVRFKPNAIIRWAVDTGKLNLNELSALVDAGLCSVEDYRQLTQLMGYSVCGYGELSSSDDESVAIADAEADKLIREL